MSDRKWIKDIGRPAAGSQLKHTVSDTVSGHEAVKNKMAASDLLDIETFLLKNKTILQNDPQRELLLFPTDDISQIVLPRKYRTVVSGLPNKDELKDCNLLIKYCCESYSANWNLIHYKFSSYSESYFDLPKKQNNVQLRTEVYEIDTKTETAETQLDNRNVSGINKQGYLMKGPEVGIDRVFANISSKYFKRRYCVLEQQIDGTFILELFKDHQKGDAKMTIVMDFCTEICKNIKKGKCCFELKMSAGHKSYTFAAENDTEFNDWFSKLNAVIQQNKLQDDDKRDCIQKISNYVQKEPLVMQSVGTLKRLEQSMNPQLMKYARETDSSIATLRKENRQKLFPLIYQHLPTKNRIEPTLSPFCEQFGTRILVKCDEIQFRLQSPNDFENEQIEPYFTTLCLYDIRNGKKLSEHGHFDLNSNSVRQYFTNFDKEQQIFDWSPDIKQWALYPNEIILSVTNPHPDIFIVVKIERILQGNMHQATEAYLKAVKESKLNAKTHKNMLIYFQKLHKYRMPFAWAARPLFRLYNNEIDLSSDFSAIYRQEVHKLSDDEFLKLLAEYRKPEKNNKLTVIPGFLKINLEVMTELPENCLTSTLLFLKPFPVPPKKGPTIELFEFPNESDRHLYPFTTFLNHLYVYPQSLNFTEGQKFFSRGRNIACCIELRDSDGENAEALLCIYGRPGFNALVHQTYCYVLHHNATPEWYEEIKIRLPIQLTEKHHLLFTFYHISCDISKKREHNLETCIGYCWIPLIKKDKFNFEPQIVPVAVNLPSGYLSVQPFGFGMGNSGPEIMWVENQKAIFSVNFKLISTIYTQDQHLQNLFKHADRILASKTISAVLNESETCKILKALHAIHLRTLINFLPTIFNLLFRLLVHIDNEEVDLNILRLMINLVHMISDAGHQNLLQIYVKYVFMISENFSMKSKTIHDDFAKYFPIILHHTNTDFLVINKFMQQSEFFLNIMNKSMAQYLLTSLRIKMHRNERFSNEFMNKLENLFETFAYYIFNKFKEMSDETKELNQSVAYFLKKCLTIMDRGFVFKLIKIYIDKCNPGDPRPLQELKFRFLQIICNHEHYVSFNLPIKQSQLSAKIRSPDSAECYTLSESFCKYHFLVSILLVELKCSLNESNAIRDIALSILKDLLIKHEFDDRYQNKGQLSRIVALYVPWIEIVLENLYRLDIDVEREIVNDLSNYSSTCCSSGYTTSETSSTKKLSMNLDLKAPFRIRNSALFESISAKVFENGFSTSSFSLNSEHSTDKYSTASQDTAIACEPRDESMKTESNSSFRINHNLRMPKTYDKFQRNESKDILLCFLFVVKYLSEDQLIIWWQQFSESYVISFFSALKMCLIYFKYNGKKEISKNFADFDVIRTKEKPKANTLPARIQPPDFIHENSATLDMHAVGSRECLIQTETKESQVSTEANLATEIGFIVLDALGLYLMHFYNNLILNNGNNRIMEKILDTFLTFIQVGQSESLYKHVFASLRSFINKYSIVLFQGNAIYCGRLCYELLKCCNSRLPSIRQEACAILYLLMRSNFEFTVHKGFTRIHLQVIISVSQMLGNVVSGLNNARFQESLSVINSYATSDKGMKRTSFPLEVKDLTKRIRTVLMATAQMKEHDSDPEMLVDLQYSLANSYASTPELRHTWLETMTRNHVKDGNYSEALFCQLHIAALIAEYLQLRQIQSWGAKAFQKLSSNIIKDECSVKLDNGIQDVRYSQPILLEQLEKCVDFIERSERFELSGEMYRFIIPMYEENHDYEALVKCYETLSNFHKKIVELKKTGKRFLGRYFRVGFYNQVFFEDDHQMEYIYKEPKVTSLSEICERLKKQYARKFGSDSVQIIMDSAPIENLEFDSKIAYIQVTHVTPCFTSDAIEQIRTDFEKNHDICEFVYETPFTKDGRARGSPEEQWRRRTILTTEYSFPYVKKRILVRERKIIELSPIEVAIDEMKSRVSELHEVVIEPIDAKKLQLKLQGSICVQVNAGPVAYASVFLDPILCKMYPNKLVDSLRNQFKEFVKISQIALDVNSKLITSDQKVYQEVLNENFHKLCCSLNELFDLDLMKPRKRSHKKLSTAAQLAQTKEGRIDLETADSILVQTNLRALLNKYTFSLLPPLYQSKLVQLLPSVDRPTTTSSSSSSNDTTSLKLNASTLNNEFFARACSEWRERLTDGQFTSENQQKLKAETEKERSRLDPWKIKHFEPFWRSSDDQISPDDQVFFKNIILKTSSNVHSAPFPFQSSSISKTTVVSSSSSSSSNTVSENLLKDSPSSSTSKMAGEITVKKSEATNSKVQKTPPPLRTTGAITRSLVKEERRILESKIQNQSQLEPQSEMITEPPLIDLQICTPPLAPEVQLNEQHAVEDMIQSQETVPEPEPQPEPMQVTEEEHTSAIEMEEEKEQDENPGVTDQEHEEYAYPEILVTESEPDLKHDSKEGLEEVPNMDSVMETEVTVGNNERKSLLEDEPEVKSESEIDSGSEPEPEREPQVEIVSSTPKLLLNNNAELYKDSLIIEPITSRFHGKSRELLQKSQSDDIEILSVNRNECKAFEFKESISDLTIDSSLAATTITPIVTTCDNTNKDDNNPVSVDAIQLKTLPNITKIRPKIVSLSTTSQSGTTTLTINTTSTGSNNTNTVTTTASGVSTLSSSGRGRSSKNKPLGAVNLQRSYQICQAVLENSPNRNQLKCQLKPPPPSLLASVNNGKFKASGNSTKVSDNNKKQYTLPLKKNDGVQQPVPSEHNQKQQPPLFVPNQLISVQPEGNENTVPKQIYDIQLQRSNSAPPGSNQIQNQQNVFNPHAQIPTNPYLSNAHLLTNTASITTAEAIPAALRNRSSSAEVETVKCNSQAAVTNNSDVLIQCPNPGIQAVTHRDKILDQNNVIYGDLAYDTMVQNYAVLGAVEMQAQQSVQSLQQVAQSHHSHNGENMYLTNGNFQNNQIPSHDQAIYHQNQSQGQPNSPACVCNTNAMIMCKNCGAFCHDDCISATKLCSTCFVR